MCRTCGVRGCGTRTSPSGGKPPTLFFLKWVRSRGSGSHRKEPKGWVSLWPKGVAVVAVYVLVSVNPGARVKFDACRLHVDCMTRMVACAPPPEASRACPALCSSPVITSGFRPFGYFHRPVGMLYGRAVPGGKHRCHGARTHWGFQSAARKGSSPSRFDSGRRPPSCAILQPPCHCIALTTLLTRADGVLGRGPIICL